MKKVIWLIIILGIIIVVLTTVLLLPGKKQAGIQVTFPKVNQEISSPLKITGIVNGNGWTGFEGQVGTLKLLDSNGQQLGQTAILTATTDWMQSVINFETTLNFISPVAQSGTLVFNNENASGLPEKDKTFSLPIKIAKTQGETLEIKVYFGNNQIVARQDSPDYTCEKVLAVNRIIPKTEAVARAALEELLEGPAASEKEQGFFTSINSGVKIQKLIIENGTANVDFDEQLEKGVGGSCKVAAIRAQITQTLRQFSTVKNVIISINGRTEDILQP